MSPDLIGEGKLLQVAHLKSLLQQSDAEWENLTRSIHRHQERLEVLQRHLAHFRLVLSLTGEQPGPAPSLLTMQIEALQQQIGCLEQRVMLENARRSVVVRQFEQTRLALAKQRKPMRRRHLSEGVFKQLCRWHLKIPWHGFWLALQRSCEWSEIMY